MGRLAALALLALPAPAQGAALGLELPAGATLAAEDPSPAASHALATGPAAGGVLPARVVEGAVAREAWQVPGGATTLQLLAPLREQLVGRGFRVLLDCEATACGGFDFRLAAEVMAPPAMFVDLGDFRYLSAASEGEGVSLLVSRSGGTGFVQVIAVTGTDAPPAPPATGAAPAEGAGPEAGPPVAPGGVGGAVEARLRAEGHAVLDGLDFAPGSADLAPGGDEALAALAALLARDPGLRLALVGHTDATGALSANVALSRRRAEAVADRLAAVHGVARGRLEAEGMGWLAPVASNLTDEGRERNRRVEAVLLPP